MKFKFILIATLLFMGSAIAAGHITKAQKEKTIECLGHYSATAVLPAETIEVKNMELALASVKVIRDYLASEGVKDDEMNKGMNAYVDKVYGKPFDKAKMVSVINLFISKLKVQKKKSKNYPERFTRARYEWIRYS